MSGEAWGQTMGERRRVGKRWVWKDKGSIVSPRGGYTTPLLLVKVCRAQRKDWSKGIEKEDEGRKDSFTSEGKTGGFLL